MDLRIYILFFVVWFAYGESEKDKKETTYNLPKHTDYLCSTCTNVVEEIDFNVEQELEKPRPQTAGSTMNPILMKKEMIAKVITKIPSIMQEYVKTNRKEKGGGHMLLKAFENMDGAPIPIGGKEIKAAVKKIQKHTDKLKDLFEKGYDVATIKNHFCLRHTKFCSAIYDLPTMLRGAAQKIRREQWEKEQEAEKLGQEEPESQEVLLHVTNELTEAVSLQWVSGMERVEVDQIASKETSEQQSYVGHKFEVRTLEGFIMKTIEIGADSVSEDGLVKVTVIPDEQELPDKDKNSKSDTPVPEHGEL